MTTIYKRIKILFGGLCVLAAVYGFGQADQRPTLEDVQRAWNAPYEYPLLFDRRNPLLQTGNP